MQVARRLLVPLLVLAAVASASTFFATLRTRDAYPLPYTTARYGVADAERAFAAHGIELATRSREAWATELGDASHAIEVTVFGDPDTVRRVGFHDLEHGRDCTVAGHLALHWRGNVRAIVNCDLVENDRAWISRVDRALSGLG